MPTTRRNIYFSTLAKHYIANIKEIRKLLREKRAEYDVAVFQNNVTKMEKKKREFDDIWIKKWPYYNNEIDIARDDEPRPANAKPYPADGALQRLNAKERWEIIATALLARRGVDKRRRLEGLVPKVNAVFDGAMFKNMITKYINPTRYEHPPSYPRGSSADYDEPDEEWPEYMNPEARQLTPPANPFPGRMPRYRNRRTRGAYDKTPEGSPGLVVEGTGAAPNYSPQDYQLEGGRKTRRRSKHKPSTRKHKRTSKHKRSTGKHKQSKHKRSKHKQSKHKRSKHKRSKHKRSKHKRSKTYKK